MLDAAIVACRFVHYVALMVLFGVSLFPLYIGAPSILSEASQQGRKFRTTLTGAALLAVGSGIVLLCCVAANMAGSWSDLDWSTLASVLSETSFGRIWTIHISLAVVIVGLMLVRGNSRFWLWIIMTSSLALVASLAGTGHAQDGNGATRVVHVVADALHLLAAGAWLGGILALFLLLDANVSTRCSGANAAIAINAAASFSGLGYVAVAVLIVSGLVNSWLLVGSPHALASTAYGRLLLFKLALFAAMLVLAALNRFSVVPSLIHRFPESEISQELIRLRHHVIGEQLLGAAVILAVSMLGTMEPAIDAV